MFASETLEIKIIGPYEGKPIAGASDDVVEAVLTIEYRFEDCTISIEGVPARVDRVTGKEYLRGSVALRLNEMVNEAVQASARARKASTLFRPTFRLSAAAVA